MVCCKGNEKYCLVVVGGLKYYYIRFLNLVWVVCLCNFCLVILFLNIYVIFCDKINNIIY